MFWSVLGYVLTYTAVFWVFVIACYWRRFLSRNHNPFHADPTLDEAHRAHTQAQLDQELTLLRTDIVAQAQPGQRNGRRIASSLDEGIVVNATAMAVDEDPDHILPGDCWLCDGRPVLMALIQIIFSVPIAYGAAYLIAPEMTGQSLSDGSYADSLRYWLWRLSLSAWSFWTVLLLLFGYRTVQQNFRLGVKRFGQQLDGFLGPGLQLVIPLIEQSQSVSLQLAEWGPHSGEGDLSGEFHLGGTAGEGNPRPGVFEISFLGAWPLEIAFGVILSVAKSDKAALDWYLNQYSAVDQVGETIARYMLGIVTTWAREEPWRLLGERLGRDRGLARPLRRQEILDDPYAVIEVYQALLNELPEVVGNILERLHGIGRRDLGGFLIRRIAQSTVRPGAAYQEVLQSAQRAEMQRYIATRLGQASADRWREFLTFVEGVSESHQALLVTMARQELDRVLYQNVGPEGSNMFNAFLADLMSAEQNVLRQRPGTQAATPPSLNQ